MKRALLLSLAAGSALLFAAGCANKGYDRGPYVPQTPKYASAELKEPVVLMDPGVQYSVTCTGLQEQTLEDGRLQVTAKIKNRENRRIEVQAGCVFKDQNGYGTGDETTFQTLILTENATEEVRFTSLNNKARKYTIRIRQAR